jgi:sulfoquinovosidase
VFVAIGEDTATVESAFGSFKFSDDISTQRWRSVDALDSVRLSDDATAIEFNLLSSGTIAGTGRATFVTVNDDGSAAQPFTQVQLRAPGAGRLSMASTCANSEKFVGLGGQSFNVNHRGQKVPLWVQEDGIGKDDIDDDDYQGVWFFTGRRHSTHTPMPMMLSSRGYALVVDSNARSIFSLCRDDNPVARYETWDDYLVVNLFAAANVQDVYGNSVASQQTLHDALHAMLTWVGKPDPVPMLVFAPWIDAIFGDANVKRVADALRRAGIAASAIWTEDFRGAVQGAQDYTLEEDWRSDDVLYPRIDQLTARLHSQGYAFLTYANTFIDTTADIHDEAFAGNYTIKNSSGAPYEFDGVKFNQSTMLDLSNPQAATWAKGVYGDMLNKGGDGWMADFAEWLPADAVMASGVRGGLEHNRYPIRWAQLNHELLGRGSLNPSGRDRIWFMRSAWLRSQPFMQVVWAGDQQTDFNTGDGIASVIPIGLGLGVTGFPYFAHDIAGYISRGVSPTSQDLFYRWVTFGALTPVMRTHHGRDAMRNVQWETDPGTIAHMRRWTRLHMQLVPYLMGSAAAYQAGSAPLFRLIALDFPDEDWAWDIRDEYLLGDRILVAPVVTAEATSRMVRLPRGVWLPLLGGPAVTSVGDAVSVAAARTEIPAFVPQGTMLVLFPEGVDTVLQAPASASINTAANVGADREVWLFPGVAEQRNQATAGWHDEFGPASITQWHWTGRPLTAGAAVSATFKGVSVAVRVEGSDSVVTVVGDGELVFAGGGTLKIQRGNLTAKLTIRLRNVL